MESTSHTFTCANLTETNNAGISIANHLNYPSCVYFDGEMGAGKTTLCKAIIGALGVTETVTSPTYNLIQEYPTSMGTIYHMDLYRLEDPSELEYLAIADLWTEQSIFLIEWPERGVAYLPPASHKIVLRHAENAVDCRQISLFSLSAD